MSDKIVHRGKWLGPNGACRPLCRPKGPAVDYSKEQSALEDHRVTCPKCIKKLAESKS